jgi:predicted anti-sigma-YlaC factor YlaD
MDRFRKLFARFFKKNGHAEDGTPLHRKLVCQEVVELITDYLEGALLPEKHAQFEEHIAGCDGCTNYFEQVRLTIGMLRNLAQEPDFPETKGDLLQAFRQWKTANP